MSTDKIEDIKDNDNRKWRTYSVKRSPNRVHYIGNDLPFVFVFFVAELQLSYSWSKKVPVPK